ncbi:MAG: acyl-CoA oxidase [Bradymonadia bacterium]|jgi:acyl-CoA oxidase
MTTTFDDPTLAPLLPLIYVAWADGELSKSEIQSIRAVAGQCGVSDTALEFWLDADNPPSVAALRSLACHVRGSSAASRGVGVTQLGMDIAESQGVCVSAERQSSIEDIVTDLHLDRSAAAGDLAPAMGTASWGEVPEPTIDVCALSKMLWAPHAKDRDDTLEWLKTIAGERTLDGSTEDQRAQVTQWLHELSASGLPARGFPSTASADGTPGSVTRFMAVLETIALFDLSFTIKAGVQYGLFGGSIYFLGSERHHEQYLGAVTDMSMPGCFAMTERGHGSNVRDLETTATYDPETDEIVVNTPHDHARKEWIGNAARDGIMATVFCRLIVAGEDHGVHAVLVPIRHDDGSPIPRVRIQDCGEKMGLHGVDNGMLWFDNVRVPRANLLDRFAQITDGGTYASDIVSSGKRFFTMLSTLVGGRVTIAGSGLAAAKTALTIAVRYSARRRQFGPGDAEEVPILDYATHQRKLMIPLARTFALAFGQQHLLDSYASRTEETGAEVEALAAAMKALGTRHATDTLQVCREACGGQGYAARNRFAALKEDSDVFVTFEGDNTVLLLLVARARLNAFKRQFDDQRVLAFLKNLAERASVAAFERNPIITRLRSVDHLRGGELHRDLFAAREQDLLQSVAGRLRKRIGAGESPFDAVNAVQNHMVALGEAYAERVVLEQTLAAIERAPESLKPTLDRVSDLYALACIERDLAWYMENGYIDAGKANAVHKTVTALCAELRDEAVGLVDAFGIPDAVLGAPAGVRGSSFGAL